MPKPAQFFRANVGAMILNAEGAILACERVDRAGYWQMPQGGLDVGEEPRVAALREVEEEIAIPPDALTLIGEHPLWLAYELPQSFRKPHLGRGQVQKWFAFRFTGDESLIRPAEVRHQEFMDWRWMTIAELMDTVTPFRLPVYRALHAHFRDVLA